MTVDGQLQNLLMLINAAPQQEWTVERAPEFRAIFDGTLAMLGGGPSTVTVEDLTCPGPAGEIALRVFRPSRGGGAPGDEAFVSDEGPGGEEARPATLVFFHGGGFVIGSIDTHDRDCRFLAEGSGCAVVSVEYRLAPEHPFPAAPDDCFAALKWVAEHGDELGLDTSRLGVGGDSAGGNLTAVTALRARDEGGPDLSFQLLVYPVVDMTPTRENPTYPSITENGEGYFLTLQDMLFFGECYVPVVDERSHAHASPLLAESLAGLPPALVMTGGYDPLRDQGEAYAKALAGAGVAVQHSHYEGAIHGVMGMAAITDIGRQFIDEAALAVRVALA